MKVPASIRRLYEDQQVINERLKKAIDARINGLKDARWHYESRIKELASYALKLESGRFTEPAALEDFFACTIVVSNTTEAEAAERMVKDNFVIKRRRPPDPKRTRKEPQEFPFDDLRLYVSLPESPVNPPTDLVSIIFEIQIKTFLQHAWAIATHDLVYKTDNANWSKERIAYQIKAMLEHAEISIQEAERLATCSTLAKEDRGTEELKEGIALVKAQWSPDELPTDVRRLADNIKNLLRVLKIELHQLEEVLKAGKAQRNGAHPSNLSPYATIVQYLFDTEKERMVKFLTGERTQMRILIPDEVELPEGINREQLKNAIFPTARAAL